MKRVLFIVVGALAVVLAVIYGVRTAQHRTSRGVAAFLPRNTVAFAHLPDFNGMIADWHRSDVYQIYAEPAVQDFLHKPLSRSPKPDTLSARMDEIQELEPTDAFVALTSIANDQPKIVGGFQFHCNQTTADRVIGSWRTRINPSAKHDHINYEKHDIDVFTEATFSIATVEDGNWFFASNDAGEIKALLDRADGRVKDSDALLSGDEAYGEAIKAMPASYAMLAYLQPKAFKERLAAVAKSAGRSADQYSVMQQIRSVCAATRFDKTKMHDVVFVGMPKQEQNAPLNRSSLGLATRATIVYGATVLDFTRQAGLLFPTGAPNVLGPAAQRMADALTAAGITTPDWEAAFGSEFNLLSEWPEQSRWPSLLITAAVKDPARARKIVDALTHGAGLDERWEQTDREGVHYWSLASASTWLPVRPAMALSDKIWITGLDTASVAVAMDRVRTPEAGLAETDNYRRAAALVPTPTNFFTYVDPVLIYSRIDATVRPFLLMGAAFLPSINDTVDLSKVPAPDVVTKHLSPIVSSQYYSNNGYIAESVGPVTLNQAALGVAALGGVGAMAYHRFVPNNPIGLPVSPPKPNFRGRPAPGAVAPVNRNRSPAPTAGSAKPGQSP